MQVPVQLEFQQIARIVTWPPPVSRLGTQEPPSASMSSLPNEHLNHSADVIGRDSFVQGRRKQCLLMRSSP